jgi:glycosyltransferase involved in cell wall biosynthesis
MTPAGEGTSARTAASPERASSGTQAAARASRERPESDMQAPELAGVRVGVVVPAYKVADHIEKVIRGIPPWIGSIVVVEDQSPDDTAARVERLRDPRVVLLRHAENRGVGGAMATGFAEAIRRGLDIVVKMDGDDQMDPAHLPAILAPLLENRADMVKCNRYSSLADVRAMPTVRLIGNAGLTFLVKMASGYWNTFDPANGYIALRTSVLERIELDRLPKRYYFESGFLVELGILRAVVVDLPTSARYGDESSSLSVPRTLLEFPPRLLNGLVRRLFWRYLVHDFSPVSVFLLLGIPMILFGGTYGAWKWLSYARDGGFAPLGEVMLAAMPIILGVQLVLQAVVLDVQNVPNTPISPPLRRR